MRLDVDRDKAKSLQLALSDVYQTLQANLGSYYVNDLARFDAERTALAAERDVIAANTERNLALIAVYKALGGGWGMAPPISPALAWAAR